MIHKKVKIFHRILTRIGGCISCTKKDILNFKTISKMIIYKIKFHFMSRMDYFFSNF